MTPRAAIVALAALAAAVLFIIGLKLLARVRTAPWGNRVAALGMLIAVVATLVELGRIDYRWILAGLIVGSGAGAWLAVKVQMTAMPQMVALLNGFGGAASLLVGTCTYWVRVVEPARLGTPAQLLEAAPAVNLALAILIGGVTFTGSVVAFLKLQGTIRGPPILLPGRHVANALLLAGGLGAGGAYCFAAADPSTGSALCFAVIAISLLLGVLAVIPIGGADMPVVIALLNSYSGMAASATGFALRNNLLIISGALVGSSGIILSKIMCDAMNRSLVNVLFGGFGAVGAGGAAAGEYKNVRSTSVEEVAMVLEAAESCIFVPGYGLAVAQAQHACKELGALLECRGCKVTYAIHPVAGRMPGHMNVLLAEADVPYDQLVEMDRINPEFRNTDAVLVLGANDVVNPAAQTDPKSLIHGMPVLEVWNARTVFVVKRSLGAGFAGVKNELFERDNTVMVFGDAKKVLQDLVAQFRRLAQAA